MTHSPGDLVSQDSAAPSTNSSNFLNLFYNPPGCTQLQNLIMIRFHLLLIGDSVSGVEYMCFDPSAGEESSAASGSSQFSGNRGIWISISHAFDLANLSSI